jgi:hypothetical protein
MLRNYLLIIARNLWKNKLYTLINVIGLGIGIASFVWGIQNYRYSFSYNNFHKDPETIFRVITKGGENDQLKAYCPMPLAMAANSDFTGVKDYVRWERRGMDIKADQSEPFESGVNFTDPAFFDFFNFPLVSGTVNLNDRSTVVITEKASAKFFGSLNPVGKTLLLYSDGDFKMPVTVTGVLKDPPLNSSINFEVITHFDNLRRTDGSRSGMMTGALS